MVPGDYYVVRVRPTGRLLGLGYPPLPLPSAPRSLVFFALARFFLLRTSSVPNIHSRVFVHEHARDAQPLGSGGREREDPLCGQKAPKRNPVMISPKEMGGPNYRGFASPHTARRRYSVPLRGEGEGALARAP